MGIEDDNRLVRSTWDALVRGDVKAAFGNLSDDVVWSIPGSLAGISGVKRGKQEIIAFLRSVAQAFPGGLRSEVRHVHAAADAVILEVTNRGQAASGKPYENEYCFVFELGEGKIRRIREYLDTQKAAAVLGG